MGATLPEIVTGDFTPVRLFSVPPRSLRVVDWNIDRGLKLPEILDFLSGAEPDLILLQEVDIDARRTHDVNVAEEIARRLRMNYVFGREFQELLQGTDAAPAYHGQATLAHWRLNRPRIIRFKEQSHFWQPHWFVPRVYPFQVRRGGRIALVTELELSGRTLVTYNVHLESRDSNRLRIAQLDETLADSERYPPPARVLVAGDLNLNATRPIAAAKTRQYGFRSVLGPRPGGTTHFFSIVGPSIDWAFVRGPVEASQVKVHSDIRASDHFPVSFTLTL